MALKGLDIFKLTPKTNCKDCGQPTCMAFAMKVAQGGMTIDKCPHLSEDALAQLAAATEPPMKTISFGEHELGGETVLLRHEKTYVSKNLFGVAFSSALDDATIDSKLNEMLAVDYERIGEREYTECVLVDCRAADGADRVAEVVWKVSSCQRDVIIHCSDPELARLAVEHSYGRPLLVGATAANCQAMNDLANEKGLILGVEGSSLSEIYDTIQTLEAAGNKNLVIYLGNCDIKTAFALAVQIRRAALQDGERSLGYPTVVDLASLAPGNARLQSALAALFVLRYGSIIILENLGIAKALPLFGLRQNIYTDPQKPMRVDPGIYPLNGADANAICCTTVDFALTYFIVSGELERSGVPVNLLISDAGGYSVLTAWAAGKLSAGSLAKFFEEFNIEQQISNRTLIIPGNVAVLRGEIESRLPGWKILVGPKEAVELVRFLRELAQ
ncbi:MAG: acetyl-CoA decarbonylase/synthase complex subunit gamma [Actinomycetia bacterium]|nr:acetyl-CoA decarbonylase/synthase complex subunit gamma [Actinomycetes bacterium]